MVTTDVSGIFDNVAHVIAWLWVNDDELMHFARLTADEDTNQVYLYGVEHIPDSELLNIPHSYVVVNDLSEGLSLQSRIRVGVWPHRVRLYSAVSMEDADRARNRLVQRFKELGQQTTYAGELCKTRYTGRQSGQSSRHFWSQVTIEPTIQS